MRRNIFLILWIVAILLCVLTVSVSAVESTADTGTLQQALNEYSSGVIRLEADASSVTVTKDVCIDLNGHNIYGVTVTGGTLYCMDSQTDDFSVADGIYGTVSGIAGDVQAAEGYVAITEGEAVSYHKVDLTLTSMALRPTVAGVYYNSAFAADEVVAENVECYGVALSVVEAPSAENLDTLCGYSTIYGFASGEKSGTLLTDIMAEDNTDYANDRNATMDVYGRAYIKTADGYTFGAAASRDLKTQVEAIDAIFAKLTDAQKASILTMYASFESVMAGWNVPNMKHAAGTQVETVVTVPVTVVDGMVAESVTVEQDGVTITVPFGTLVDGEELALTVTRKTESDSGIEAGEGQTLMPFDIHVDGIAAENTQPVTVALGKVMPENLNMGNYTVYHVEECGTNEMTLVESVDEFDAHNQYKYDLDGNLTLHMDSFSEVAALSENDNAWNGGIDYTWYSKDAAELEVRNADQLAGLNKIVSGDADEIVQDSFENKTVKLLSDLDFNGSTWYPIGYWAPGNGTNAAGETEWYTYGGGFAGAFDGNGNTVANIYQNTWALNGNYDAGYWDEAMGLFGYVVNGTVKNLTVKNFTSDGEFTPTGCVTAFAENATFENIALVNCNPRVYNTGNGGIVGIGGNSTDPDAYKLTFNNITIDNSNKITALWGSWDVACGGLVGMFRGAGHIYMNNCHVAAQIDVYNDVCGNYQYYWYRYSGMLVGTNENMTTDENGYTVPETHKFHATNCTVHFGTWNDYYYCELVANSLASYTHDHQFSRLTVIHSLDEIKDGNVWTQTGNFLMIEGDTKVCYHIVKDAEGNLVQHNHADAGTETVNGETVLKEDKQIVYLPFDQLFTGYGWGVKHIPLGEFDGVTILAREPESNVKFEDILSKTLAQNNENLVIAENTVLEVGQIFQVAENIADVKGDKVQVFVSPADESSTVVATSLISTDTDWTTGTLQFKGHGAATITVTDYYYCIPTVINVTVDCIKAAADAMDYSAGGTVSGLCPACAAAGDAGLKAWSPMPVSQGSVVAEQVELFSTAHYYLDENTDYTQNTQRYKVQGGTVCLHLNGQTMSAATRTFWVCREGSYSAGIVNVMGDGTIASAGDGATRGAAFDLSDGTVNIFGGTYETTNPDQAIITVRNGQVNMFDGTVKGAEGNTQPSVYVTGAKSGFTMYGGTVEGSPCNISVTGSDATFNMQGGTVDGGVQISTNANVSISGDSRIGNANSGLQLAAGVRLGLGEMTENTQIYVTATGVFTGKLTDAQAYLDNGYILPVDTTIIAENDVLVAENKYQLVAEKAAQMTADGVFDAGGSVTADCPYCGTEDVQWAAFETRDGSGWIKLSGHYYLDKNTDYTTGIYGYQVAAGSAVCLHLNGQTLTQDNAKVDARTVWLSGGTLTIMGEGTFSGYGAKRSSDGKYNPAVDVCTGGTLNLCGGTYTHTNKAPIFGSRNGAATINIYNGTTIQGVQEYDFPSILFQTGTSGSLNLYGGQLLGGNNIAMETANAACNLNGGIVDGGVQITAGRVSVSGNIKIINCNYGLKLTPGILLEIGEMHPEAEVWVHADGVFTGILANAEELLDDGIILPVDVPFVAKDNVLMTEGGLQSAASKASKMTEEGIFAAGGTVEADCPCCGETDALWEPFPLHGDGTSWHDLDGHYYLDPNMDYTKDAHSYRLDGSAKKVCLHLNGQTLSQKSRELDGRTFFINGGTLNIMGEGTFSGFGGYVSSTHRGGIEVSAGGTLNLCGGTYTRSYDEPVVATRNRSGTINIYSGTTVISDSTYTVPAILLQDGSVPYLNLYGGVVDGGIGCSENAKVTLSGFIKVGSCNGGIVLPEGTLLAAQSLRAYSEVSVTAYGLFTEDLTDPNRLIQTFSPNDVVKKVAVSGNGLSMQTESFLAGIGREVMTPDFPVYIAGGEDPSRVSTGAMEDLYATCIALTDLKGRTALIFTVDMQSVSSIFGSEAKASVSAATGIPEENIMIAATHNHTAPGQNQSYTGITQFLTEVYVPALTSAAQKAMEDRAPATAKSGSTQANGLVFVRHYLLNNGTYADSATDGTGKHAYDADDTLQMVQFVRDGKKDIVLMNLGVHATFNGGTSTTQLSANFPGYARDYVEANTDCYAAYFISAGGDQVPKSALESLSHGLDYQGYGEAVGKLVVSGLSELDTVETGDISFAHETWIANTNKDGIDKLEKAQEIYDFFVNGGGYTAASEMAVANGFVSIYECRSIVQHAEMGDTRDYTADAISVGDISFTFASFELFGETGAFIRENSPYANTFVVTCANASNSYVPTQIAYDNHFYEAYTSHAVAGTAEEFAEKFVDMLTALKNGE